MGGSTREMMTLIYTSTLKWTLIASALAVPLSLLYLDRWLKDYSLRIPLYWWIFTLSIVLVVLFQRPFQNWAVRVIVGYDPKIRSWIGHTKLL